MATVPSIDCGVWVPAQPGVYARLRGLCAGTTEGEIPAMLSLVLKRLAMAIPSLIGVVIVPFLLTRALPGDPAAYFAGPAATKEAVEQIRKKLGFAKPLIEQFFH